MKVKRKRRMSRRRRERTYIAVMVLLAIAVSIGLTRSVMRDDKEFEEYEQQSQEFNARMQRIDEKREASGQNAMLEQVRTWQQEQDTEPDKYAVFDTMSADWGGEEDGFVLYEIPEEYSRTGGYFPEKMQVYTYCVCKQYGVRYDLVVALIEKESGYKFDKVGDDGHSIGYMQIYEEYHRDRMERLNVTDLTNPYQNVLVGIDYLSELIERYGTIQDALAAYNYGEQGAKQHLWAERGGRIATNTTTFNREILIVEKANDGKPFELHTSYDDKEKYYRNLRNPWLFLLLMFALFAVTKQSIIFGIFALVSVIPGSIYQIQIMKIRKEAKTQEW